MSVSKIKGWVSLLLPLRRVPVSDLEAERGYPKFSTDIFSPSMKMQG
jgi:hypothetical protein